MYQRLRRILHRKRVQTIQKKRVANFKKRILKSKKKYGKNEEKRLISFTDFLKC